MEKDGEATLGLLLSTEATETALYPLCRSGFVTSLMKHMFQGETSGPSAIPTPTPPPTPTGKAQVGNLLSATHEPGGAGPKPRLLGPRLAPLPTNSHRRAQLWAPPLAQGPEGRVGVSEVASCLAVPRFEVAPLTCGCEEGLGAPPCRAPRCSLRALGQLFTFSFLPELGLLAASFTSERVVNASFWLLRGPPHHCFTGGRALLPWGSVARVTYCSGQLVSGSSAGVGDGVLKVWLVGSDGAKMSSNPYHTARSVMRTLR